MPEPRTNPAAGSHIFKEAVCIDAKRIYDSCSDKDFLEDLRVFYTDYDQPKIDEAINVKIKDVEVISVYLDVEPVPFNKGFYAVDMTFFFAVRTAVYTCPVGDPEIITGICSFSKKCILFGSEGCVKTFISDDPINMAQNATCNPKAYVQCVDPIVLASRLVEYCGGQDEEVCGLPTVITERFNGSFYNVHPAKAVLITLGLFTIVQLERNVQMMIPAYDFAVPDKECTYSTTDDPCEIFRRIKFPTDEFFPPKMSSFEDEC